MPSLTWKFWIHKGLKSELRRKTRKWKRLSQIDAFPCQTSIPVSKNSDRSGKLNRENDYTRNRVYLLRQGSGQITHIQAPNDFLTRVPPRSDLLLPKTASSQATDVCRPGVVVFGSNEYPTMTATLRKPVKKSSKNKVQPGK